MQAIQLSIPQPCHESWDKMTPTEKGRFCNACAKQVVDFTNMSDGEVLNYFIDKKNENVCGRVLPDQLNRKIEAPKPVIQAKQWYWKYAAAASLLFFGKEGKSQQLMGDTIAVTTNPIATKQQNVVTHKLIKGKVINEQGEGIPFATISEERAKKNKVQADVSGEFQITVLYNSKLTFSSIGFETTTTDFKMESKLGEVILKKDKDFDLKTVVITVGMMVRREEMDFYSESTKHTAIIKVKDLQTGEIINSAKLLVKEKYQESFDTIQLKNGIHKIKKIKEDDELVIKAEMEGYESSAISLSAENFNKRKGVFEIALKKKVVVSFDNNVRVTLRGSILLNSTEPLYVVNGNITNKKDVEKIDPNTIENITILKDSGATAIYGKEASSGVIVIVVKKIKALDTVVVKSSEFGRRKVSCGFSVRHIYTKLADTLKSKTQSIFSAIKTYPNPVKKGEAFTIDLSSIKQTDFTIVIKNSVGEVVLHQQNTSILPKQKNINLTANTQWGSGLYYLQVQAPKGKVLATCSFLVL